MVRVQYLHPQAQADHVGFLPQFLDERDPRPAREQFHANYQHGGGWHPMEGYRFENSLLLYPGDPPLVPLARMKLRGEMILVYECGIVNIVQPNGDFEVARMD